MMYWRTLLAVAIAAPPNVAAAQGSTRQAAPHRSVTLSLAGALHQAAYHKAIAALEAAVGRSLR
jgi:hypothetical protein